MGYYVASFVGLGIIATGAGLIAFHFFTAGIYFAIIGFMVLCTSVVIGRIKD